MSLSGFRTTKETSIILTTLNNFTMTTLYIKDLIGQDILNRISARDILEAVNNIDDDIVVLNFEGVLFTTRSFMDEFYNAIIKENSTTKKVKVEGMSEDLSAMLDAVSRTQRNPVEKITPLPYTKTDSVSDLEKLFASISI